VEWDELQAQWAEIWSASHDASIFNSFPVLKICWDRFLADSHRLHILLLSDGSGAPLGLAPLSSCRRMSVGFPVRVIEFIERIKLTDRALFMLPEDRQARLAAIFSYLKNNDKQWDVLEFREQVLDDSYREALEQTFPENQYYLQIMSQDPQPYLDITAEIDSWDKYLAARSKNHRKHWRTKNRKLEQLGEVEIQRVSDPDEFDAAMLEFQKIEKKSWKQESQINLDPKEIQAYKDASRTLLPDGGLHFQFLRLDGVAIAGHIGMFFRRRYAGLQSTYDLDYADYSPGFLVGGHDVKWAVENGFQEYDFMSGYLNDKKSWTDTLRETSFVRIIRKKAFGGLFYNSVRLLQKL
jgi:CelD/BcsL family acetyltransferase involved in cellulose biosynthesis